MNVIVIVLDTLRQDHVGVYHQGRGRVPGYRTLCHSEPRLAGRPQYSLRQRLSGSPADGAHSVPANDGATHAAISVLAAAPAVRHLDGGYLESRGLHLRPDIGHLSLSRTGTKLSSELPRLQMDQGPGIRPIRIGADAPERRRLRE